MVPRNIHKLGESENTMKKTIEFTTLNISMNYNRATLRNEKSAEHVAKVINWLVRNAELEDAKNKVKDVREKALEAIDNGEEISVVLSKDEIEIWEEYKKHESHLNTLISKTEYTEDMWKAENEVDKVFLQLIALPNMPKKFARAELVKSENFSQYMDIAEKYFATVNGKVDSMKSQLEKDYRQLHKGGDIFRGVRVRPNGIDTKKFLSLFITDIRMNDSGVYDFKVLYTDKKKTKKVEELVNKFLALYIVNRMDCISPLTDKEEKEYMDSLKKQEEITPAKTPEKKLSEKSVNRIKNARKKKEEKKAETPVTPKEETPENK